LQRLPARTFCYGPKIEATEIDDGGAFLRRQNAFALERLILNHKAITLFHNSLIIEFGYLLDHDDAICIDASIFLLGFISCRIGQTKPEDRR
jgi:hypothetical protein